MILGPILLSRRASLLWYPHLSQRWLCSATVHRRHHHVQPHLEWRGYHLTMDGSMEIQINTTRRAHNWRAVAMQRRSLTWTPPSAYQIWGWWPHVCQALQALVWTCSNLFIRHVYLSYALDKVYVFRLHILQAVNVIRRWHPRSMAGPAASRLEEFLLWEMMVEVVMCTGRLALTLAFWVWSVCFALYKRVRKMYFAL